MHIRNAGPRITETDYWTTEHATRGYSYLSVNAGAVRLLVPDTDPVHLLEETRSATRAAIQLAGAAAVGIVHLVFEDGTDSPLFVTLQLAQCDRSLPLAEVGRWVRLGLYRPRGQTGVTLAREIPALIRAAAHAIDLTPIPAPG